MPENKKYSFEIGVLLFGTVFLKAAAFISIPYLAIYLSKTTSLMPVSIGIIIGLSPLASLAGGFLGGQLSDIFARSRLLLISVVISAISFFGFFVSSLIETELFKFVLIGFFNVLNGFFASFFPPISLALLSDLSSESNNKHIYQLRYWALNLGAAIGPVIGGILGVLSSTKGFFITFIVYAAYAIILIIFFAKLNIAERQNINSKPTFAESLQAVSADKKLFWYICSAIIFTLCYSQIQSTLPQFLIKQFNDGLKLFTLILSLNAVVVLIFQYPVYLITKKFSTTKALILGTLVFSIGYLILSLSKNVAGLYVFGVFVISISEIAVFPISSQFIDQIAPAKIKGAYFGAQSLRQLGYIIGPIFGGWMLQKFNSKVLFMSIAVLALFSCVFHLLSEKQSKFYLLEKAK